MFLYIHPLLVLEKTIAYLTCSYVFGKDGVGGFWNPTPRTPPQNMDTQNDRLEKVTTAFNRAMIGIYSLNFWGVNSHSSPTKPRTESQVLHGTVTWKRNFFCEALHFLTENFWWGRYPNTQLKTELSCFCFPNFWGEVPNFHGVSLLELSMVCFSLNMFRFGVLIQK